MKEQSGKPWIAGIRLIKLRDTPLHDRAGGRENGFLAVQSLWGGGGTTDPERASLPAPIGL